jgi:serine/threonine protein kinase
MDEISMDGRDLLRAMIEPALEYRLSAEEALNHSWFNSIRGSKIDALEGQKLMDSPRSQELIQCHFEHHKRTLPICGFFLEK